MADLRSLVDRTRAALSGGPGAGAAVPPPFGEPAEKVLTAFGDLWLRADDSVMLPMLRSTREWEPDEGRLLTSLVRPGTRFLDVGANVGYFSAMIGLAAPGVEVIAVEPEPTNLALLRLNLWNHVPDAEVWGCALADGARLVSLASAPGNPGDTRSDSAGAHAAMVAPATTGDEVLAGRTVDLVKVDVQGFELEVVRGLARTIARSPRIALVVEFLPSAIRERDLDPAQVLEGYRTLGLDIAAQVAGQLRTPTDRELLGICADAGADGFVNLVLRHRR